MPRVNPTIWMSVISTPKPPATKSAVTPAPISMWLMGRVGFKDSMINHAAQASPNAPVNVKHEPIPNPDCRMSNITCDRTSKITRLRPSDLPSGNARSATRVHFVVLPLFGQYRSKYHITFCSQPVSKGLDCALFCIV